MAMTTPSRTGTGTGINGKGNVVPMNLSSQWFVSVDRSQELLACARTVGATMTMTEGGNGSTHTWHLCDRNHPSLQQSQEAGDGATRRLEDAAVLLRKGRQWLDQMSRKVRRRGHTNDPTAAISRLRHEFDLFQKDLAHTLEPLLSLPLPPSSSSQQRQRYQRQRDQHYRFAATVLQSQATRLQKEYQQCLALRAEVLRDQAERRKQLNVNNSSLSSKSTSSSLSSQPSSSSSSILGTVASTVSARTATHQMSSQLESPLFTMTNNHHNSSNNNHTNPNTNSKNNGNHPLKASTRPSFQAATSNTGGYGKRPTSGYATNQSYSGYTAGQGYGGYGAATAAAGYGGTSSGMRRRNAAHQPTTTTTTQTYYDDEANAHANSQQQQQQQQMEQAVAWGIRTRHRKEEAQRAERSIAELTKVFGRMASLVQSQEETLEWVEQDVEQSLVHTTEAGHHIAHIYDLKKGNRSLIVKVFAILIGLIVFVRVNYHHKS